MRQSLLLLIGALLVTSPLLPQSRQPLVTGLVTDTAGCPLAHVSVYVPGTTFHVITDSTGKFTFDSLPTDVVSLRASFIGFKSSQLDSVPAGRSTRVAFQLSPSGLKPTCSLGPPAPAPE
jgi:Carboxypeptidase regulatory-like domain